FTALQAEPVQLSGVAVYSLLGSAESGSQSLTPFLDPAAPAFEDPHTHIGGRTREERQVNAEPLVIPGLWAGVGQQIGEAFLAFRGEFVHPACSASPRAAFRVRRLRVLFDDPRSEEHTSELQS